LVEIKNNFANIKKWTLKLIRKNQEKLPPQLATELKLDLEKVAKTNLEKLFSRQKRGKIQGSGDNR